MAIVFHVLSETDVKMNLRSKALDEIGTKNEDIIVAQKIERSPAEIQEYNSADAQSPSSAIEHEYIPVEEHGKKNNIQLPKFNLHGNLSTPGTKVAVEHDELPVQVDNRTAQLEPSYAIPGCYFSLVLPYATVLMLFIICFCTGM